MKPFIVQRLRNRTVVCIFGLLIVSGYGAFLRFFALGAAPYWMDEGYTVNAILSYVAHGSTLLDSGIRYSCPLYCPISASFASFFGAGAVAFRLLAAIAGSIFVLIFAWIARRMFDARVALAAGACIALSYWQIAWSRQARWYTLFECALWLSVYFFYEALHAQETKRRVIFGILCALSCACAVASHALGYLLPFIFAAWLAIEYTARGFHGRSRYIASALGVLTVVGVVAWWGNVPLVSGQLHALSFAYELPYYLNFYLRQYWLFVIGIALLISEWPRVNRKKREIGLLSFVFVAYLIPLSFFENVIEYRYLFAVSPVLIVLGIVGFSAVISEMKVKWHRAVVMAALIGLFLATGGGVVIARSEYALESDTSSLPPTSHVVYVPQPDWNGAYAYVAMHRTTDDAVISSMPQFNKIFLNEAGYWIAYDYQGKGNSTQYIRGDREVYVNAFVIADLRSLQSFTQSHHGYIVFDYLAADNHIDPAIIAYIQSSLQLVYHTKSGAYSEAWVYRF